MNEQVSTTIPFDYLKNCWDNYTSVPVNGIQCNLRTPLKSSDLSCISPGDTIKLYNDLYYGYTATIHSISPDGSVVNVIPSSIEMVSANHPAGNTPLVNAKFSLYTSPPLTMELVVNSRGTWNPVYSESIKLFHFGGFFTQIGTKISGYINYEIYNSETKEWELPASSMGIARMLYMHRYDEYGVSDALYFTASDSSFPILDGVTTFTDLFKYPDNPSNYLSQGDYIGIRIASHIYDTPSKYTSLKMKCVITNLEFIGRNSFDTWLSDTYSITEGMGIMRSSGRGYYLTKI